MALYKKTFNGSVYWYLREMARVDGKPKMVSERYLGNAKDIEELLDAKEAATVPEKTRHLGFRDFRRGLGHPAMHWTSPGSSTMSLARDARMQAPQRAPTWYWWR